jgi:hypothetical protein
LDNDDSLQDLYDNCNNKNNKYYKETVILENCFANFPLFRHVVVKQNNLKEFSEWIIIIISAAAEQAHIAGWYSAEVNIRL